MTNKTIIFILSTNYAGSHYLSLLLGSNSKAIHLGEVKNLLKKSRPCFICGNLSECAFFKDIGSYPRDQVYDVLFSRTPEGVDILVDNSKKLAFVEQYIGMEQYNLKVIHLIRDPRALVRRWLMTYTGFEDNLNQRLKSIRSFPSKVFPILFGSQINAYVYKWIDSNQSISRFIQKNNLDPHIVTYRDLAKDTPSELQKIMEWVGADYESEQLKYWLFKHHGTQKKDYEWIKKKEAFYFDLRWQEYLTEIKKQHILENKLLQEYISKIGLKICDEGLTKIVNRAV